MMHKVGKHGKYAGFQRIRDAIKEREPFRNSTGTFRGVYYLAGMPGQRVHPGRLPSGYIGTLMTPRLVDYVIYSYNTPIAWRWLDDGSWVTPATPYSTTTSHHQGQAFAAIASLTSPCASYIPVPQGDL